MAQRPVSRFAPNQADPNTRIRMPLTTPFQPPPQQ
jgi:hypothetical protein